MLDGEHKRLILFARLLAVSTLACLAFSWKLWLSRQLYPMAPVLELIPEFHYPYDRLVLALLVAALIGLLIQPLARRWSVSVLLLLTLLFLQDQNRLWPSFYHFYVMLLLLASATREPTENDAHRVLNAMRFVLAMIYFWGGVQKLNPHFFEELFPWFMQPLTSWLPFEAPMPWQLGVLAGLFEVLLGLGLLTRRFRQFALYEALLMHAAIFVCIGPLRGNWNNSAWIWGQVTAAQVVVLFWRAPAFSAKEMLRATGIRRLVHAACALLVGIMPVLNNFNLWDSALSFNVYSGNVDYAEIHLDPSVVDQLPTELEPYLAAEPEYGRVVLHLNQWAQHEFNANTYPETRIYLTLLLRVCQFVPPEAVALRVREKAGWFFPKQDTTYMVESRSGEPSRTW